MDSNQNQKKTALITGASSGIGRASLLRMTQAGWQVFATVRKKEDSERLASEGNPDLIPLMMDVKDRASIERAAAEFSSRVHDRGLDGLVNVAGIGMVRPVEYATADDLQEIFDINLFGQIAVTQAFLPHLRKARGRIVNITSVGVNIAIPFGSLLNASKSAFGMFSDTMRMELYPFGVRVSTIEPGAIKTPAVDKTLGDIEGVIAKLPPEGAERYGEMLRKFAEHAYERENTGSSPDVVAMAVQHALTAPRPRIRYRVGKDAKLLAMLGRFLPDLVLDATRRRLFEMPSEFGALERKGGQAARKPGSRTQVAQTPLHAAATRL